MQCPASKFSHSINIKDFAGLPATYGLIKNKEKNKKKLKGDCSYTTFRFSSKKSKPGQPMTV
jgi:hypothetical protein